MSQTMPASDPSQTTQSTSAGNFFLLCLGGYLFSIAYGITFLLPLLITMRGGNEAMAGNVISVATISTVLVVILSGHIADLLGTSRSVAMAGLFLFASSFGFALSQGTGASLLLFGLILGIGWGVFYTLGPILVAAIITPTRRSHYFALLSGSMMAGIGTGPIIGRIWSAFGFSIESTFMSAGVASLLGCAACFTLSRRLRKEGLDVRQTARLSWPSVRQIGSSTAIFPILMVGIGGAIFGGLSSFQTSYASELDLDYSLYFLGFMTAAIFSRLFLSGYVVNKDPLKAALGLTSMILISVAMFSAMKSDPIFYTFTAIVLGGGYGLTYSVINGQVANEAPDGLTPQALLLFSLSYMVGVFGFPLIAGNIIVTHGILILLYVIAGFALLNISVVILQLSIRRV